MGVTLMGPATGLTKSKLSLATANEADVVAGKTFYGGSDKNLRTGTLYNAGDEPQGYSVGQYNPGSGLNFYIYLPNETSNKRNSAKVTRALRYPATAFGNAAASSVLSGATFSSSAGLKVSGTMANRGSISASLGAGGSKSYSAGYYSGGTVTCSDSLQFAWGFLYNINRNYYQLGLNSNYGSASGATWTCKKSGTYRIAAICNDSIGQSGVGIKKNGSWLFNGTFVNKNENVWLSSGDRIQIIGGNMYGDSYSPCVGVIVIWHA